MRHAYKIIKVKLLYGGKTKTWRHVTLFCQENDIMEEKNK